jgi:hypothetical protein
MSKNIIDIQQPENKRNANYKLLEEFNKWKFSTDITSLNGTCANLRTEFESYNFETKKYSSPYGGSFYNLISAPMLLARLVAAGCKPLIEGIDNYKCTWEVILIHKDSGAILTFYDYKGASSFGTCDIAIEQKQVQKDLIKLIKALVNPRFPHPYDSCVVGEIA